MIYFALFSFAFLFAIQWLISFFLREKKVFRWIRCLFFLCYFTLGIVFMGIHTMSTVSNEKPILKICLTGNRKSVELEWKNPHGLLQQSLIEHHEVSVQTMDGKEISRLFLSGELIGIRAKIYRLHPLLTALGISNKYHLDLIYTGYRSAEKYAHFPVEAHPLLLPSSFFHSLLFKYWDSFFSMRMNSIWIKTATLESNYFPMTDENGNSLEGEFLLTISSSGLSARV